jgi:hypothetical protein
VTFLNVAPTFFIKSWINIFSKELHQHLCILTFFKMFSPTFFVKIGTNIFWKYFNIFWKKDFNFCLYSSSTSGKTSSPSHLVVGTSRAQLRSAECTTAAWNRYSERERKQIDRLAHGSNGYGWLDESQKLEVSTKTILCKIYIGFSVCVEQAIC